MKKLHITILAIVTLFLFSACNTEPPPKTDSVYELTIKATEIYNDHVGTDWKKEYICDGKIIHIGETFTIPINTTKTITIDATITEKDKWNDVGSACTSVILKDGFETESFIEITESHSTYKGNKAKWKIKYIVELVA
jgi:hypothetical protein